MFASLSQPESDFESELPFSFGAEVGLGCGVVVGVVEGGGGVLPVVRKEICEDEKESEIRGEKLNISHTHTHCAHTLSAQDLTLKSL